MLALEPFCLPPLAPAPAAAQGFSLAWGTPAGYAEVRPDRVISFPADHGAHPDFRIEWWYVTANLADATGAPLGVQWTLFRFATRPRR